jgi:hypothetical protein
MCCVQTLSAESFLFLWGSFWQGGKCMYSTDSVHLSVNVLGQLILRDYSIHKGPEFLSLRRNWVLPPPAPQVSVAPPGPKWGAATPASGGGDGTGILFRRRSRNSGTLPCTLVYTLFISDSVIRPVRGYFPSAAPLAENKTNCTIPEGKGGGGGGGRTELEM